jgi:hypothetical protein
MSGYVVGDEGVEIRHRAVTGQTQRGATSQVEREQMRLG